MDTIPLPDPNRSLAVTLTAALAARRTRREVRGDPLGADALSLLLWAAHGITSEDGRRTAPSAGFTDPSTITAITAGWMARYRAAGQRQGEGHGVQALGSGYGREDGSRLWEEGEGQETQSWTRKEVPCGCKI